jgi:hypothetical protein
MSILVFFQNNYTDYTNINDYTVEPGYNDIGLYVTSSIASDIVVPIISSLLTVILYSSVKTTLVYNDTKYSVPFMTL